MTRTEFYVDQLRPLVGGRVNSVATTDDGDFFGLVIATPDGKQRTVLFLSDDEGNGPGSFEILD